MSEAKSGVQACLTAAGRQGEYGMCFCSLCPPKPFEGRSLGEGPGRRWAGYKGGRVLRVSRYKIEREQVSCQGTQCFIAGTGAFAVQAVTDLSWEWEQSAKTLPD